jgi:hypothetical protein
VAIGTGAGACCRNSGPQIAIGHDAGHCCQGGSAVAIGRLAGACCQGWNGVAIGRYAGSYGQCECAIAIGRAAGNYGQCYGAVAIGQGAQNGYGGSNAVAIGTCAGYYGQCTSAVAIGHEAGKCEQQFRAVGIGRWAGHCCQGSQSVAIGALAGRECQQSCAIAIGRHAGTVCQGYGAVAIGHQAGQGLNNNSNYCHSCAQWVSGGGSGETTFVVNTVAGIYAGMVPSGSNLNPCTVTAVNTGTNELTLSAGTAGQLSGTYYFYGRQGEDSIAIGSYAGRSVQHDNSVIINATGIEVNSAGTATTVVKPLRQVAGGSIPLGFYQVAWNPTTGELIAITP